MTDGDDAGLAPSWLDAPEFARQWARKYLEDNPGVRVVLVPEGCSLWDLEDRIINDLSVLPSCNVPVEYIPWSQSNSVGFRERRDIDG